MSTIGFCFDIDGVLTKRAGSGLPVPTEGAVEALALLKKLNIPYLFITNDGSLLPKDKAVVLSKTLGIEVNEDSIITSITPMKTLNSNSRKLVVGYTNDIAHMFAKYCGITNYITLEEYYSKRPYLLPSNGMSKGNSKINEMLTEATDTDRIEDIVVFVVNQNFYLSSQIICDILMTDGIPGKDHLVDEQVVRLHVDNYDLTYGTNFSIPRIGCGGFMECCKTLFKMYTNRELKCQTYGKPSPPVFQYSYDILSTKFGVNKVYMVGDNPETDIKSVMDLGGPWSGILVKTGLYDGQQELSFTPNNISDNAYEGVKWALEQNNINY